MVVAENNDALVVDDDGDLSFEENLETALNDLPGQEM